MAEKIKATAYRINYVIQKYPIEISFPTNSIIIREIFNPVLPNINTAIQYYDTPESITSLKSFEVSESLSFLVNEANITCITHIQASILSIEDSLLDTQTQYSFPIDHISIWPFIPSGKPYIDVDINSFIEFKGVKYYAKETASYLESIIGGCPSGTGSVTSVSFNNANGISGTVLNPTTTPLITLSLEDITPTSINSSGTVVGSNLSGTNTGDQTITLTGDITGSGTGSFNTSIGNDKVTTSKILNSNITYSKIQDVSANTLLGNPTGIPSSLSEIPLGTGLAFSGGSLINTSPSSGGTVTSVSVTTVNGVSGNVTNPTTTPAIALTLGAITPSSVAAVGTVTGSNLSGTNTGDQTITLTGDVTGSGTGSFVTAIGNGVIVNADVNASAAIDVSKLAPLTASRATVTDASGFISSAITTATEIGYVNGVTSSIQTQLNAKTGTVSVSSPITSTGGTSPTIGLDETTTYIWSGVHTRTTYENDQTISTPATPSSGTISQYGTTFHGVDLPAFLNSQAVEIGLSRDLVIPAKNITGSTIAAGSVVYINGANGNIPTIALSQADYTMTKLPALGFTLASIANNGTGIVLTRGTIKSINTSGFSAGDTVYVSDSTPGAITNVAPTDPSVEQAIGTVTVSGVGNGEIAVNLVPINLHRIDGTNQTSFSVGDAHTAGPMSYKVKQTAGTGTLQWTVTGNRTLTLPDTTDTLVVSGDTRLAPTPSGAGKMIYDTGTAYLELAAGTSSQVLIGGSTPAFGNVPSAALTSVPASALTGTVAKANGGFAVDVSTGLTNDQVAIVSGNAITIGALTTTAVPNLDAGKITTGTFAIGRIPTGTSSSTVTIGNDTRLNPVPSVAGKIPYDTGSAYSAITNGTTSQVLIGGSTPSFGNVPFAAIPTGTSSTTVTIGNDTRLPPTPTAAGKLVYDAGSSYAETAAGTSGQVLKSAGAASPTWGTAGGAVISFYLNTGQSFVANGYLGLAGDGSSTVNVNVTPWIVPVAGTLTNLRVFGLANTVGNVHILIYKASNAVSPTYAATALDATVSTGTCTANDTTHSVSVSAGDLIVAFSGASWSANGACVNVMFTPT